MASDEDKAHILEARSQDERVLIYRNLLLGVTVPQVCQAFRKSEVEVMAIFHHVSRAITQFCFLRKKPPIFADAIAVAQRQKHLLLKLVLLVNLDKPIARIDHNALHGSDARGVLRAHLLAH